MINPLRALFYLLFVTEIICFAGLFSVGPNGMAKMALLQQEDKQIQQEIEQIKHELTQLEKQIDDWYANSFLREKIAREELQMARDGDQIYLINS